MNISVILQQFNLYDHQIVEFMGHPVIEMPTSNPRFPNVYGKVRLSVMLRSLPCVLAFIASDGQSFNPEDVTDEDLELVINHLRTHIRPQQHHNNDAHRSEPSLSGDNNVKSTKT